MSLFAMGSRMDDEPTGLVRQSGGLVLRTAEPFHRGFEVLLVFHQFGVGQIFRPAG